VVALVSARHVRGAPGSVSGKSAGNAWSLCVWTAANRSPVVSLGPRHGEMKTMP
jgi:hypothetical protein